MNIPNFLNEKIVDKEGYLTAPWQNMLIQLITELQKNAGNEGLVMPSQTAANIALLTNSSNGTLVYDSTNNIPKVNVNGTFKSITFT